MMTRCLYSSKANIDKIYHIIYSLKVFEETDGQCFRESMMKLFSVVANPSLFVTEKRNENCFLPLTVRYDEKDKVKD